MMRIMKRPASIIRDVVITAALTAAALTAPQADAATLRAPGGGAVRALAIGVDTYPNLPRSSWLRGAVADARDIYQSLAAAGVNATLLVERDAVRPRVVAAMNRLVQELRSGDLVIVSFAGHGMRVPLFPKWTTFDPSPTSTQIVLSGYGRSGTAAQDIIFDKEMRAWLARFDAKGVDVLVAIDACFGGGFRHLNPLSGSLTIRRLEGGGNAQAMQSFDPITMTAAELRVRVKDMRHVTFLAGADDELVVPEMPGIGSGTTPRGALSYFVARAVAGEATNGGPVSRDRLFRYMLQNVKQATGELQIVGLDPAVDDPAVGQAVVFRFDQDPTPSPAPVPPPPVPAPPSPVSLDGEPVRVAVANGPDGSLSSIKKGRAPFVASGLAEADLVWDVAGHVAESHGDRVQSDIDGTLMGGIIDRTWAIREIHKLSAPRVLQVGLRDGGRLYTPDDRPQLSVSEVAGRYLTVVNIAGDGTVQMLFPFHPSDDPLMRTNAWSYRPTVNTPFGADHVVAVATTAPATGLLAWLRTHNNQHDAADLPAAIARAIADDPQARIGTVGLYTAAR